MRLQVLSVLASVALAPSPTRRPHIVMVLGDDIGFANVGFNRPVASRDVSTPRLDQLAKDGIHLLEFYAFKYCSPSRCALQSGRNPIHINVVNGQTTLLNPSDPVSGYSGIPTNVTTIAEKLKGAGYKAHAVGKWDAGMATLRHTPAGRGYESWLGYFGHCNDYWTELDKCGMASCPAPGGDPEAQPVAMVDMWFQDENGKISRPASDLNNSQSQCSQSHQTPSCHFEDDVFHSRVLSVLHQHSSAAPPSTPLFLFWAPHACHGPREVPAPTYDEFAFIDDPQRRMYCALMHYLDSMIGNVVDTMQEMGMWSNTLFVFASDNGGDSAANNWPLRGGKFSNWQGGIHVPALVSGGFLPPSRRGIRLGGMATLWDLYATFGHVAGLSAAAAVADPVGAAASLPPIDSIDQWDWWSGRASEPPRAELAIGTAGGSSHGGGNLFRVTSVEALIRDGMKLILTLPGISVDTAGVSGVIDEAIWTGPDFPNKTSNANAWNTARDCSQGCLYNLTEDHTEHVDLASALPLLASQMRERLEQINRTAFSPARGPNSPLGCAVALEKYGGFWGPFADQDFVPAESGCRSVLQRLCPFSNFSTYEQCRSCISDVMHDLERSPALDPCKPAAPAKFQAFCCERFKHPINPNISCTIDTTSSASKGR